VTGPLREWLLKDLGDLEPQLVDWFLVDCCFLWQYVALSAVTVQQQ